MGPELRGKWSSLKETVLNHSFLDSGCSVHVLPHRVPKQSSCHVAGVPPISRCDQGALSPLAPVDSPPTQGLPPHPASLGSEFREGLPVLLPCFVICPIHILPLALLFSFTAVPRMKTHPLCSYPILKSLCEQQVLKTECDRDGGHSHNPCQVRHGQASQALSTICFGSCLPVPDLCSSPPWYLLQGWILRQNNRGQSP